MVINLEFRIQSATRANLYYLILRESSTGDDVPKSTA